MTMTNRYANVAHKSASLAQLARRWSAGNGAALFALFAAGLLAYINTLFGAYTGFHTTLTPDSAIYIRWHPYRTPGYPAFAHAVHFLTGDIRWVGVAQLNLALLSFVALAWGLGHLTRSRFAALASLPLLFGLLPVIVVAMQLWAETLFTALVCFHLTGLCFYLRRPSSKAAACISGTVALIYLARPAGLPFAATLPLLFIIPLLHAQGAKGKRPPFKRLLAAVCLPILAGLLLMASLNKIKHDSFSAQSFGGVFLLAHIAHLLHPEDGEGAQHEQLMRDLAAEAAPLRERIAAASGPRQYWRATMAKGAFIGETLVPRLASHLTDARPFARLDAANTTALELAAIAISAHPRRYAEHAAAHYLAMWRFAFLHPSQRADLPRYASRSYANTGSLLSPCLDGERWFCGMEEFSVGYMDGGYFLDEEVQARVDARAAETTFIGRLWRPVVDNRAGILGVVLGLSLASVALLPLAARGRGESSARELILFCVYLAAMLNLNALFIAAAHPAISRYTLPLLPLLPALVVCMTAALWRLFEARLRSAG